MNYDWPFADPPNVAVFTVRRILEDGKPILRVCHDEDDGGWHFLDGGPCTNDQAMIVSLQEVVSRDPTIAALADLPVGWEAARSGVGKPWERRRMPPSEE